MYFCFENRKQYLNYNAMEIIMTFLLKDHQLLYSLSITELTIVFCFGNPLSRVHIFTLLIVL